MPNLKRKFTFFTGNPHTRRCIKCGKEMGLDNFYVTVSPKQAREFNLGGDGFKELSAGKRGGKKIIGRAGVADVRGHEFTDGTFMRGYRRIRKELPQVLGKKCLACRTPKRYARKPPTPSFLEIQRQIRLGMDTTKQAAARLSKHAVKQGIGQDDPRFIFYHHRTALMKHALYLARERSKKGTGCPPRWELLLKKAEREKLQAAHAAVLWPIGKPTAVF